MRLEFLASEATRLGDAIRRAVEQHGAPNRFAAGELETTYGGPRAATTGVLMTKHTAIVAAFLAQNGLAGVAYERGRPSMIVVPEESTMTDQKAIRNALSSALVEYIAQRREADGVVTDAPLLGSIEQEFLHAATTGITRALAKVAKKRGQ